MIRKKLLALGISAVAVTAVAGAGFAGWTFTKTAKDDTNLGIHITAAYSFGTVAIDANAPDTVVLDQSGVTLAKSGALSTAIANVSATWTVNTDSYSDAGTNIAYTANVYLKDAFVTYVNCGSTTAEASSDKTGYKLYKFTITPAEDDITTNGTNTVVTLKLANPLTYTASKPENLDDYKAMVTAVTGESSPVEDTTYSASDVVIVEFTVTKTTT